MASDLVKFLGGLSSKFNQEILHEKRITAARMIAEQYSINPPQVILMFTMPEFKEMTVGMRCERVGITEEEFFLIASQDGFQRFTKDFEKVLRINLDLQSLQKLSQAVTQSRQVYSAEGSPVREDLSVELKALDKQAVIQQTQNVQNNFFDQARQRAMELEVGDDDNT